MTSKEYRQIIKGINTWAKKSKKYKWLKFGNGDTDWYDYDEVAASIQSHIGLGKFKVKD